MNDERGITLASLCASSDRVRVDDGLIVGDCFMLVGIEIKCILYKCICYLRVNMSANI